VSEFHRLIEEQIPRLRRYARALTRNRERALAQLPLEQRQVILLVGLEGMSYEDAAGILSVRDILRKLLDMEGRRSVAALAQAA
jgi:RNA polymerase sigma-70 factor (ECF subfamily)